MSSSEFLSLPQLVEEARGVGLDVTERTVKFYTNRGLLPKPTKAPFKGADGRVAYYPAQALRRLRRIHQLKGQGFTLEQIARFMEQRANESLRQLQVPGQDWKREAVFHYLKSLASEETRRARVEFAARVVDQEDELVLQRSASMYLVRLAAQLVGEAAAQRYVEEFLLELPLDERERRMAPFREWRARIRKEEQERQGDAYLAVRRLTSDRLLGLSQPDAFVAEIAGLQERFAAVRWPAPADPALAARVLRARALIEEGLAALAATSDSGPEPMSAALEVFERGYRLLRTVEQIGTLYLQALDLE